MGSVNCVELEDPENCAHCDQSITKAYIFYPHEKGHYCIFAPREGTEFVCEDCAFKECEDCGEKQPRFAFIECKSCKKTHCFNNTDMKYEDNPFLDGINLCNSRKCQE